MFSELFVFCRPARRGEPLFSSPYESLFPQSLYFHIHTKPPGVWGVFPFSCSRVADHEGTSHAFSFCLPPLFPKTGGYGGAADFSSVASVPSGAKLSCALRRFAANSPCISGIF